MSRETFMNNLVKENNFTETENGATALKSTLNACLDAFATLGTVRTVESDDFIISTFSNAYAEDKETALRMLFYLRDIRGGQGARRVFRVCMKWLAEVNPNFVISNFNNFLYFGRGDDFFCLIGTSVENAMADFVKSTLLFDLSVCDSESEISLMSKWMKSENTSSAESKEIARWFIKKFGWSAKTYREVLSKLRSRLRVVEQKMSAREWKDIDYEKVPSKASMIYSNAFERHDESGYIDYIKKVASGEAKVNAGALYPYDIVHRVRSGIYNPKMKDRLLLDGMWKALPDYSSSNETGICVVDVSGSMSGEPMDVAISLGMYNADKCRGPFKGKFITFSSNPSLQSVVGNDIVEKVHNLQCADWDMNTDLEAVFNLILHTAVSNHTPQEDLPSKLYIISDMQFDEATTVSHGWYSRIDTPRKPFMQEMKNKYAQYGYKLPGIVYWNVRNSKCGMFQETFEGENCCMVSGYSPSLFKSILEGTTYVEEVNEKGEKVISEKVDPMEVMRKAVYNERYDRVVIA